MMNSIACPTANDSKLAKKISHEKKTIPILGGLIKIKEDKVPEKKSYHLVLKGDSIKRLERLQTRVGNGTQAEVIASALQVFEELLREYDNNANFYIKRLSDNLPQEFNIFECV